MTLAQTSESAASPHAFRIRGTNVSLVVLELHATERDLVLPQLQRLLIKAPAFLWQAPIILGLAPGVAEEQEIDLPGLVAGLQRLNLHPIGILAGPEDWQTQGAALGLPVIPKGTQRSLILDAKPQAVPREPEPPPPSNSNAAAAEEAAPAEQGRKPSLLITRPVRAGTEIYADGGADLIVTATVNPGAEVIADGNIHVYGALKGRAIAGANGNEDARIFALSLDPELLAVAGFYTMHDDIDRAFVKRAVEVSFEERSFHFRVMGN